jgi:CBS domain containing-hemolysin-like protein
MLANVFYILAAILLVILNGFFVAAEFSLVKLRHTQAVGLAERIGWRGRILLSVHEHLDAYLSACQLGITLASLGLGWIGEPAFSGLLQPVFAHFDGISPETTHIISFIFAFTVISFLHIVLGELAPKSLAIRRPEHTSAWTATPLYVFYWIMYPAIWILNASANLMLRLFGLGETSAHEHHYSRDELKLILHGNRAMRESGEAFDMMSHALDLPELVAGDLLRTRDQLGALHDGQTQEEVLAEIRRSQFSRYPWFDADLEEVRGILHVKDLLLAIAEKGRIEDMIPLRPAIIVRWTRPSWKCCGVSAPAAQFALATEEGVRRRFLHRLFKMSLQIIVGDIGASIAGDTRSVGGLIVHRLERLPTEGETLKFDGFSLTVRTMQGARAQAITVKPDQPPPSAEKST